MHSVIYTTPCDMGVKRFKAIERFEETHMRQISLRERLENPEPLLADGGMGTLLHQRGTAINDCFDSLNLTHPDLGFIGIISRRARA